MTITLHHASLLDGPTGISFQIGATTLFAPDHDARLYVIDPAHLVLRAPVGPALTALLLVAVIEPRLSALVGGPVI
jgi:hypothetical protein